MTPPWTSQVFRRARGAASAEHASDRARAFSARHELVVERLEERLSLSASHGAAYGAPIMPPSAADFGPDSRSEAGYYASFDRNVRSARAGDAQGFDSLRFSRHEPHDLSGGRGLPSESWFLVYWTVDAGRDSGPAVAALDSETRPSNPSSEPQRVQAPPASGPDSAPGPAPLAGLSGQSAAGLAPKSLVTAASALGSASWTTTAATEAASAAQDAEALEANRAAIANQPLSEYASGVSRRSGAAGVFALAESLDSQSSTTDASARSSQSVDDLGLSVERMATGDDFTPAEAAAAQAAVRRLLERLSPADRGRNGLPPASADGGPRRPAAPALDAALEAMVWLHAPDATADQPGEDATPPPREVSPNALDDLTRAFDVSAEGLPSWEKTLEPETTGTAESEADTSPPLAQSSQLTSVAGGLSLLGASRLLHVERARRKRRPRS